MDKYSVFYTEGGEFIEHQYVHSEAEAMQLVEGVLRDVDLQDYTIGDYVIVLKNDVRIDIIRNTSYAFKERTA